MKHCSRLGIVKRRHPAMLHLLYIVYSISCKLSTIPIQSFHLTLTDSQTIKKRSIMAIQRLWTFFQSKGTLSTEKRYFSLPRKIKTRQSHWTQLNTKDKISRGYNNNNLSRTDNIANNVSNVNNTNTKFSLDVDRFQRNFKKTKGQAGLCELLFR